MPLLRVADDEGDYYNIVTGVDRLGASSSVCKLGIAFRLIYCLWSVFVEAVCPFSVPV